MAGVFVHSVALRTNNLIVHGWGFIYTPSFSAQLVCTVSRRGQTRCFSENPSLRLYRVCHVYKVIQHVFKYIQYTSTFILQNYRQYSHFILYTEKKPARVKNKTTIALPSFSNDGLSQKTQRGNVHLLGPPTVLPEECKSTQ